MYVLTKLNDKKHKYQIITPNGKKIKFGAYGYSDYTIHKNKIRKQNYIARHQKRENWNDLDTAGFYSRWILWNKPTLEESIKDTERKFKIKISTPNQHIFSM